MLVKFLIWLRGKSEDLLDRYDRCHQCGDRADYWCEGCGQRHCMSHESWMYDDCAFCRECEWRAEHA